MLLFQHYEAQADVKIPKFAHILAPIELTDRFCVFAIDSNISRLHNNSNGH